MTQQRTTNGKRQREQKRQDRAREKQARLAARRAEARTLRDAPPPDPEAAILGPAPPDPSIGAAAMPAGRTTE